MKIDEDNREWVYAYKDRIAQDKYPAGTVILKLGPPSRGAIYVLIKDYKNWWPEKPEWSSRWVPVHNFNDLDIPYDQMDSYEVIYNPDNREND